MIPINAHRSPRRGFYYPGGSAPRTAILVPWFRQGWLRKALFGPGDPGSRMELRRSDHLVRVFNGGWSAEAELFQPGAIAGTKEQLFKLAASAERPELTHSIICLGKEQDVLLTGEERDRLWRVFEVPVFEQIIGPQGELLASECEAHDGLHIQVAEFTLDIETEEETPRKFLIETSPCACGRRTPRLTFTVIEPALAKTAGFAH